MNRGHIFFTNLRNVTAVKFQTVCRILSQEDGVHPPGVVPDVFVEDGIVPDVLVARDVVSDGLIIDGKHRFSSRINIFQTVGCRRTDHTHRRQTNPAFCFRIGANCLHHLTVRQQRIVCSSQYIRKSQFIARCMRADMVSVVNKNLRFVDSHPICDAVGQLLYDHFGIIGKPIGAIRI